MKQKFNIAYVFVLILFYFSGNIKQWIAYTNQLLNVRDHTHVCILSSIMIISQR